MKKVSYFFEQMAYWKVWLITTIIVGSFFGAALLPSVWSEISIIRALFGCSIIGGLFGLFVVLMSNQMRGSMKFWAAAEALHEKIPQAKTLDELKALVTEFYEVRKLGSGEPHWSELRRIKTRIEDRQDHIKDLESIKTHHE